jgi:hypothetical protein
VKYYNLNISTNETIEHYNQITDLLGVQPITIDLNPRFGTPYDLWTYQICEDETDDSVDFINIFLDLLEPKFAALKELGVKKEDILFWLYYEYDGQCAMEFHPAEMKRLGESGIHLNIDCLKKQDVSHQ